MNIPKKSLETTAMGIRCRGELEDVASFSEEVKNVLEEVDADEEDIEEFDYWKPEENDDENQIKDRTVKTTSIRERKIENDSEGIKNDLSRFKDKLESETEDSHYSDQKNSVYSPKKILSTYKKLFKPIASESLKLIRRMEEVIYSKVMLNFNPCYFDSKRFSVSLKKDNGKFEINFNSPEKKYRRALKQRFNS